MFGYKARRSLFDHEVQIEIEILEKFHGDGAAQVAREKAARPSNRTARRKVLEEAARRLNNEPEPRRTLVERLFG
ncbi:MAG: hypothetical protein ACOVMO_01250 [Caulobacter sp.]